MYPKESIDPVLHADQGEFAVCESLDEALVLLAHLTGPSLATVEYVLQEMVADRPREDFRQAADKIGSVGMRELASTIRRYARKAKPAPPSWRRGLVPKTVPKPSP